MWVGGQRHAPAALPAGEKYPVSIVEDAVWAPGPVLTGVTVYTLGILFFK